MSPMIPLCHIQFGDFKTNLKHNKFTVSSIHSENLAGFRVRCLLGLDDAVSLAAARKLCPLVQRLDRIYDILYI